MGFGDIGVDGEDEEELALLSVSEFTNSDIVSLILFLRAIINSKVSTFCYRLTNSVARNFVFAVQETG